jgi:uncharacterized protein YbbC (DUF1343 family)
MKNSVFKSILLVFILFGISCNSKTNKKTSANSNTPENTKIDSTIIVGANQIDKYLPILKNKKVGIVANQTSVIFKNQKENEYTHLVDSLVSLNVNIVKVFAPEHGFRGTADAGEHLTDGVDNKTGLPIFSLYGKNRKPSAEHMEGIDFMIFDIQDVGVRFYTYIGTLHYMMEACAEANIPLLNFRQTKS